MTNRERYDGVFREALGLEPGQLGDALAYGSVKSWDSVGHMTMMAAIESTFGIVLETDDVVAFSSYAQGMEILRTYGVEL